MNETKREGFAETLRGVVVLAVVGVALGLAFNALGLASRPPRGLSWITHEEKLPSLEELQPGSGLVPPPAPRARAVPALSFVGTAWAGEAAASDTAHAGVQRAPAVRHAAAGKPVAKKAAPTAKKPTPVPKPVMKVPPPAAAAATPPAPVKLALPVVPELDTPIEVKIADVKRFYDAGAAVFLDAREAAEYAEGHIAGALSVPFDDVVAKPELITPFQHAGKPIICYCSGGDCELSKDLAKNLLAAGIRRVLVFTDGFPAWKSAGYPVQTGAAKGGR